ncbi:MAG: hypothetical protein HY738_17170 [Bacteroidia bacterium]|nr:hypothetical protein [Bacteroidia bacterium]
MKKLFVFTVITLCCYQASFAQSAKTAKDIFTAAEIYWFGLDFSQLKCIGDGFSDAYDIKNKFFSEWNKLVITEGERYNFKKALRKNSVPFDISMIEKVNSQVNADKLVLYSTIGIKELDQTTVEELVKKYTLPINEGIGLVFIIDSFDKTKVTGTMYVTFFDLATKKVLLTEKMEGKAVGVGFRNFWAGTVYSVLKEITLTKYDNWNTLYNK